MSTRPSVSCIVCIARDNASPYSARQHPRRRPPAGSEAVGLATSAVAEPPFARSRDGVRELYTIAFGLFGPESVFASEATKAGQILRARLQPDAQLLVRFNDKGGGNATSASLAASGPQARAGLDPWGIGFAQPSSLSAGWRSNCMGRAHRRLDPRIITRHEGLVWVKRKKFFETDLNPRYLLRRRALSPVSWRKPSWKKPLTWNA